MNAGRTTLPEHLLLLAVDPATGRPVGPRNALRYGVAAAVLTALEASGAIAENGRGRVTAVGGAATGDPVHDHALRLLGRPGRRVTAWRWIRGRHGAAVLDEVAQRLAARGAVTIQNRRILGVFPSRRYMPVDRDLLGAALADFRGAAKTGFPEPRDQALAGLVHAMGLERRLLPGVAREVRRTVRHLARSQWPARAVARAVASDRAEATV